MGVHEEAIKLAKEKGYYHDPEGNIYSSFGYKLELSRGSNGYLAFSIKAGITSVFGRRRTLNIKVHKFIAYCKYGDVTFIDGVEVRHLNNNCQDNSTKNLVIGTKAENAMDKDAETRLNTAIYASSFIRKFTDEQEAEIREFHEGTRSYKKTMAEFGVKKGTLHYILHKVP